MQESACESCNLKFKAATKFTLLGFQKMICPECGHASIHELKERTRIFYYILIAGGTIWFFVSFSNGQPVVPGVLFFAVIWALLKDRRLSKKTDAMQIVAKVEQAIQNDEGSKKSSRKNKETDASKSTYCHNCGLGLEGGAKFCMGCGVKNSS